MFHGSGRRLEDFVSSFLARFGDFSYKDGQQVLADIKALHDGDVMRLPPGYTFSVIVCLDLSCESFLRGNSQPQPTKGQPAWDYSAVFWNSTTGPHPEFANLSDWLKARKLLTGISHDRSYQIHTHRCTCQLSSHCFRVDS